MKQIEVFMRVAVDGDENSKEQRMGVFTSEGNATNDLATFLHALAWAFENGENL